MKKILKYAFVAAFAVIAGYSVYTHQKVNTMSKLVLANVEALANDEGGSSENWACWSKEKRGSGYWRCGSPCKFIDGATGSGTEGKCYKN